VHDVISAGGGAIFNKTSNNLKTWFAQSGIEFRIPYLIQTNPKMNLRV
jgi:hypothetical protein